MANDSIVPLKDLQVNQQVWTVQLKVLRVGDEITCGTNFSVKIKKLIMMDDESVRIGVVIFNDDIQYFDGCFFVHKTYIISNGVVNKSKPMYFSAHPKLELVLKKITIVKEASIPITGETMSYNFVDLREIDIKLHSNKSIDVCGVLIKVKP
ncbi:hypothetical protein ABFS82_09G048900 [Erythranthe guttata]|uniref:replication protein A 70 kDa DNA-binding subunit B-like n=1 Tax=Erythranthe guttata TaxID=4155 RepID=UPI00064D7888|nr:PREDICTED: replication protein A 70 kDa DNA-binding subunit B-like [Erythranthe guttata]|eukprot:XP_012827981.1 PREDICTED: replication protein A 70 kDa DNA-binding subunit B-like [Erythranthe guttata]